MIHLFIVSMIAPVLSGAMYTIVILTWKNEMHGADPGQMFALLMIGGVYGIYKVFIPAVAFAVLTAVICYRLVKIGMKRRLSWVISCAFFGLVFGSSLFLMTRSEFALGAMIGSLVGASQGLFLRRVWIEEQETD
jgi:4-amino-4-deoxy-L-arabinose transferase-like glycosyltransferase